MTYATWARAVVVAAALPLAAGRPHAQTATEPPATAAQTQPPPAAAQTQPPAASLTPADLARLRAYQERLVIVATLLPGRATVPGLVGPMLTYAGQRSVNGDAVAENRAALIAVAFYANGWPLQALTPEARNWPRAPHRDLQLRTRGDLAQHFLMSAWISASAGAALADAAGLYKEMHDLGGASGFSFSDLAADRAGTRLGQVATASDESARRLQARVRAGLTEDDLMPGLDGLPDNLPQAEFARRFGGVGAPAYNALVADINQRVAALSLFQ
jgi:hypothetical protein